MIIATALTAAGAATIGYYAYVLRLAGAQTLEASYAALSSVQLTYLAAGAIVMAVGYFILDAMFRRMEGEASDAHFAAQQAVVQVNKMKPIVELLERGVKEATVQLQREQQEKVKSTGLKAK